MGLNATRYNSNLHSKGHLSRKMFEFPAQANEFSLDQFLKYRNDNVAADPIYQGRVAISLEEQKSAVNSEKLKCYQKIVYGPSTYEGNHCNTTWDGIACWDSIRAGDVAQQQCPSYIHGFYTTGLATRRCLSDGQWYVNPEFNKSWTNYTGCTSSVIPNPSHFIESHLERLALMYHTGYGISLISLIVAFVLMIYFRRLHCPRNIVHLNLFASFIFRAALSFLKDNLLVQGVGLPDDVSLPSLGTIFFKEGGAHWECKLLFTTFHYVLLANYFWLFIEGLYLHTLIIVAVFSEKSRIRWYLLMGWVGPLVFVIPWMFVRLFVENTLCWNTNPTPAYFWIMRSAIVSSIIINFAFFLNIVRVLFTKLKSYSTPKSRRCRHRRLAKSTLVLIPLFGVHYMVFIGLPDDVSATLELIRLYYEMFFNSFQGFFVALLYCFLNGEVQSEIRKKWIRYKLKTNSRKFQKIYWQTSSFKFGKNPSQSHLVNSITSERRDFRNPQLQTSSEASSEDERKRIQMSDDPMHRNGYRLSPTPKTIENTRPIIYLKPTDEFG
ncbi:secretin receptor isoform X2 [Patella vulgata]|uniref:secretin receptor isoform X2 n=1 Tax=Patella vulgata TaxID=6465 RepID=UPI00217FF183|nr:secretin receptor isoform X2 [Patella vulgata]